CPRVLSPWPGRATVITRAPNQASNCVQVGPDWTWVKSRMRTPLSAFVIVFAPLLSVAVMPAKPGIQYSLQVQSGSVFAINDVSAITGFPACAGNDPTC